MATVYSLGDSINACDLSDKAKYSRFRYTKYRRQEGEQTLIEGFYEVQDGRINDELKLQGKIVG